MSWNVVRRKLGKAGDLKRRTSRQRDWDRKYGEGCWSVGYVVDGEFLTHEQAYDKVYVESYQQHFNEHPEDLEELLEKARGLRNPHAEATGCVDLQVQAIMDCIHARGLSFRGRDLIDIGTWHGEASHAVSVRTSPLQIKALGREKMTLERFWQSRKCLAVWAEDSVD